MKILKNNNGGRGRKLALNSASREILLARKLRFYKQIYKREAGFIPGKDEYIDII